MLKKIKETADFLKSNTNFNPKIGIILGTGLGKLVQDIDIKRELARFALQCIMAHKTFEDLKARSCLRIRGSRIEFQRQM